MLIPINNKHIELLLIQQNDFVRKELKQLNIEHVIDLLLLIQKSRQHKKHLKLNLFTNEKKFPMLNMLIRMMKVLVEMLISEMNFDKNIHMEN
jgi:hypothetical protein